MSSASSTRRCSWTFGHQNVLALTEAGEVPARDTPATNVREGGVLAEMAEAMAAVAEAHARHPDIRLLVPGKGTRHVLGSKKAPKVETPVVVAASVNGGST